MSLENWPETTQWVGGREEYGRWGLAQNHLEVERYKRLQIETLQVPGTGEWTASRSLPTDALFPHSYTVTKEYSQPHLTSRKCGLVPVLLSRDLSKPWFSLMQTRNGMTPATVPCNREHQRQGDSAPFPHSLLCTVTSVPTPAHRCQGMPC